MFRVTLSLIAILVHAGVFAQNFDSACVQQRQVLRMLQVLHVSPPPFDRVTNREIIDLFIRTADERNVFFARSDTEALYRLTDEISSPDVYCAAISLGYAMYTHKLHVLDSLTGKIESSPLVLDGTDTINFVFRRRDRLYYEDISELHGRLEKRIKYDVLRVLGRSPLSVKPDSISLYRAKTRSIRKLRRSFEDLHDPVALLSHLSDCMSDAIARRCDPHSNYLNASGFGNYRNALSTHERSFGFSVTENNAGDLVIDELVPGGPAWNSEELEEKDLLLAIRAGGGELIPAFELGADEINAMLRETSHEIIELTLLDEHRKQRTVELRRAVIHSGQNAVAGFLVQRNGRRMGLISIPSFYMDESGSRSGCANDVAREIIRLKQDSIEGLIIDLRFNGGGSMREAIGVAGLFIDEGPVAIYQARNEPAFMLKDPNRGTVWDGPLLVIINCASASASEFVAAALQDYDRAIIAGSESFGKGTAQNLLPADTNAVASVYTERIEAVMKITGGKFYRLTGQSLQARGITPDIPIPGVLENVLEREAQLPFFLACDTVEKVVPFDPAGSLPRAKLQQLSRSRLAKGRFQTIIHLRDSLRVMSQSTERVALSLPDYRVYSQKQKDLNQRVEHLFSSRDADIVIAGTTAGSALMKVDPYLRKRHQRSVTGLSADIVFHETVMILSDLIELERE